MIPYIVWPLQLLVSMTLLRQIYYSMVKKRLFLLTQVTVESKIVKTSMGAMSVGILPWYREREEFWMTAHSIAPSSSLKSPKPASVPRWNTPSGSSSGNLALTRAAIVDWQRMITTCSPCLHCQTSICADGDYRSEGSVHPDWFLFKYGNKKQLLTKYCIVTITMNMLVK